jgi:uncharacterized protein YraI
MVFLSASIPASFAQDSRGEVSAQAYRTVNVRQGPGTQFQIIGQLQSGDSVAVNGRSDEENNWLRIDFNNSEGWIAFFTVSVTGQLDVLPIIDVQRVSSGDDGSNEAQFASPFVSESQYAGDPYVITFRRVNVRIGAGAEFPRLGFMNPGNVADLTGRTDDSEWLQINFNGQVGWVAFFVVSVNGDLASVPIVHVERTPQTPTPTQIPTPTPLDIRIVTRFNSNLRTEPDFSSSVIGIVPYNTELRAEARTADSGWIRVTYEGQTGWLITPLVRLVQRRFNDRIELLPIA